MSNPRLLESIRLVDGEFPLLDYHQRRVDRSWRKFYPRNSTPKLRSILDEHGYPDQGLYKVRIEYEPNDQQISVQPYSVKKVNSLRLIAAEEVCYQQKFADRKHISDLYAQRNGCDDVLFTQHGYITDTSYANVAFFDGRYWFTPAWPMLRGTRRAKLIDTGKLKPLMIRVKDLDNFEQVKLINAMLPWKEGPVVPISSIVRF
ncbi:MAG: aminotransferase class IV [Bacteroidota bacterium]